jgi:phage gp37-like protein
MNSPHNHPVLTNLLVLQDELVAHLKAELADLRPAVHVLTPSDMASKADTKGVVTLIQPTPAVNVVFMGSRPSTDADKQRADGRAMLIQQLFVAEVVTRNVRDLKSGAAARNDAGELAARVLLAVMATRLPSAVGLLKILPGPGPVYQGGNQYLPITIETALQVVKVA